MNFDYGMEKKLLRIDPELHRIFANNVSCCQNMLIQYKAVFPNFTDHSVLHSLEIIAFCNELIGDYLDDLNADEIFILLMAAYLHDVGMGITKKDYENFLNQIPEAESYVRKHPEADMPKVIRMFHNEFSGKYITKYAPFFDFPSEQHRFSVIQVSRGHRKLDLFDENEFPKELVLPNGNTVHLPYLSAMIRMADEIDIAADRNIQFLFDFSKMDNERDRIEFNKHKAIKQVLFEEDHLRILADFSDESIREELELLFEKLKLTLEYCVRVIREQTPFTIKQNRIVVQPIEKKG